MRLAAFGEKYPFLRDNLPFWEKYTQAREELLGMMSRIIDPERLREIGFLNNMHEGKPFFAFENISLASDDVTALVEAFCDAMGLKRQMIELPSPVPLFENLRITEDEGGFILAEVHAAIASYVESVIAEGEEVINWLEPYCPVCGSAAGMGLITPSGKKNLVCSHCHSVWAYMRTSCGLCGHSEERGATFFSTDEAPNWLIETCGSCGYSLKVCDMRNELPDIIAYPLHYLTTWELDLAAREKGFEPALFGVFMRAGWLRPLNSN